MFAIDTNLLVYAHNQSAAFNKEAKRFLEKVMNERNEYGHLSVCLPAQVVMEFLHVMTWQRLEHPLSLSEAIAVVQEYLDTGITIITHRETQIATFLELLRSVTSRKRIFDIALVATLKDNSVIGLYTLDIDDFKEFDFLTVINPLESQGK